MKRQLLLLLCIATICIARGQTTLHYWFDGRGDVREQMTLDAPSSSIQIDVANLTDGLHTLFMQTEDTLNRLSAPKGFPFIHVSASNDTYEYHCWFDNDESRTQSGVLEGNHILLDVSNLSDGLHTVQIQLSGAYEFAPLSYRFIKVPQIANTTLTYVCLIDDQPYAQQEIENPGSLIHMDLDVADLSQGLHKIQIMLASASGAVTGMYTSYFYRSIMQSETGSGMLVYNIDGKQYPMLAGSSNGNQVHFDIDVMNLENGLHHISYGMAGTSGLYGNMQSAWFYKIPEGGEGIYRYEYWLNGKEDHAQQVYLNENKFNYQLVSLLPVDTEPIRSKTFQFSYRSDTIPVVYAKNDFHIRFWASGGQLTLAEKQYVDERVCDTIQADTLRKTNVISRPQTDEIHWFSVRAKEGDSLALKTNKACLLQIFSPSGEEVYTADAVHSVKWGGCHTREQGMFYIALHDVTSSDSTITLSSQHINRYAVLKQDVNRVGNAGYNTITFEGNGFDSLMAVDFVSSSKTIHALQIGHESNVRTSVIINCLNVPLGTYDVVFHFPDDEDIYLDESLTIETATEMVISTELDYNPTYLMGGQTKFTYTIHNSGNMTAYGVPVSIQLGNNKNDVNDIYIEGIDIPSLYESTIESLEREGEEVTEEDKEELKGLLKDDSESHIFYEDWTNNIVQRTTVVLIYIPPQSERTITVTTEGDETIICEFSSYKGIYPPVQDGEFDDFPPEDEDDYIDDPEGEDPNNPGGEDPNNPGGEGPSNPGGEDPSNPGGEDPSNPGGNGGNTGGTVHPHSRPSIFCCHHKHIENGLSALSYIPIIGCGSSISSYVTSEFAGIACDNVSSPSLRDRTVSWLGMALACSGAKGVAGIMAYIGSGLASGYAIGTGNNPVPGCDDKDKGKSDPVDPSDPNDIRGYISESGSRYMRQDIETIHYEIEFENDTAVATAPAHTIIVRDTLDANRFDLSSFAATEVTIGDRSMKWNTQQGGTQTLDMRTRMNVLAQVQLDYSDQTGIAQWTITSLDPMTMEPITDAETGVLPVNFDGNGMGTLSYRIRLKEHFADGTQISNRASIIFDNNEPILTPVWTNTIDAVNPTSSIADVMVTNDSIAFMLNTYDERSQVWHTTVYARADSTEEWQIAGVAYDELTQFQLQDGWTQFYVQATDSAGNTEDKERVAEYNMTEGLVRYYLITFLDEDETTVLSQRKWAEGAMPECAAPYKPADAHYAYTFSHWNPEPVIVTEDAYYVAVYSATPLIATDLDAVNRQARPAKVLKKGVMYILMPDGRKYTILGSPVK